jgi:hypothetical protein
MRQGDADMGKEMCRIKAYFNEPAFKDMQVWVVAQTVKHAKAYLAAISRHVKISNYTACLSKNHFDAMNPAVAVILLCGEWYLNPLVDEYFINLFLKECKKVIMIPEIPDPPSV